MKRIKLDFCGFWGSFKKEDNLFTRLLSKHFNIEISESPDFVICSNRGIPFEYMKYDCPRIMFMGENVSPDFMTFDYVIGFDFIDFGDRYFRLPFAFYSDDAKPWIPRKLTEDEAYKILKEKKYFANFVYGHESAKRTREALFERLNEYKSVISPGSFMNNVFDKNEKIKRCSWQEKNEYLKYSKFTIAGDSIEYPGFVTEKIVQPFKQHSIPIYWGNPEIDKDFNKEAFVWCKGFEDLERTIKEVEYIDTHDDAYVHMLMQCPLRETNFLEKRYEELEEFLVNIFSQELEEVGRRVKYFSAEQHEKNLKEIYKRYGRVSRIKKIIKEIIK